MLSHIFPQLPNGIIRDIVAYTGETYKKRDGKYMRQILKNDPRYKMIYTIPKFELKHRMLTDGIECYRYKVDLDRYDRLDLVRCFMEFKISMIFDKANNYRYNNDFMYTFNISSLNPECRRFYRQYTYEEGIGFERRKFKDKWGPYVLFLAESIWVCSSCLIVYCLLQKKK